MAPSGSAELDDHRDTLRAARILLLEDDALISVDAEDMLMAMGAREVFVAHTLADGEELLDREPVDAAVLDLLIGHQTCDGLARRLLARGIPFVFASGYPDASALPEEMRHVPQIMKPYSAEALRVAFERIGLGER